MSTDIPNYRSLTRVGEALHGMEYAAKSEHDRFMAKRSTWDTRNPVRVIPGDGGGGYSVALIIGGSRPTEDEAQQAANYIRYALNLAWMDLYGAITGDPTVAEAIDTESDHYEEWRKADEDEEATR